MSFESSGTVDFVVGTETYQTWYKIFGDLKSSEQRPVVVLHGGPGMTHHYMLPHKEIWAVARRPVILYDQLGNGASSHCAGVPREFWGLGLFMDELENLLGALGVSGDFDLLGHSWGGILAATYAATRAPRGLMRLIILNAPASVALSHRGTEQLLSAFPAELVRTIRKHEADETTDGAEYQACCMEFYKKHLCTLDPWPEDLLASFRAVATNPTVRRTLMGPSEFNVVGHLKSWSVVDDLHKIACPVLLISSPQDVAQECAVLPFFLKIAKVKWVELQDSAHFGMYEEPERYFKVILDFLSGASPT
ncbi:hypothetical protein HYPSUDRAFT_204474 [Hypholoma sublateritium FD-334 SS-4]|uniref:AB hydrolase-1 domain-containing protein n=1 Tax=Hypholoma sublateritium (strain FD-334 SS-4) TaxID=945553 RepID=A0A0D2NL42_HYPSF|nr:hypothetical protein HYPSUDRAFT_204474 [Hypholoma sublateritium FD-334 SS-4]